MTAPLSPGVGAVLSADIAVPEHERQARFYSRVLSTGDSPLWSPDLMNNLGMPIIGLGAQSPEYAHLPLQWMPHIQVADVAASAERALAGGGGELMHARDEDGGSQWAVLTDPNGAAFGIIPVLPAEAIPPMDGEPRMGRIGWLDLTVPNADATRDFYRDVIGWSVEPVAMQDGDEAYADYNMLGEDGQPKAGVCHARGMNTGFSPVWMLYLPVDDLDESLRRVREEGGRVVTEAKGEDGAVMYAVIEDPVGVSFALMAG